MDLNEYSLCSLLDDTLLDLLSVTLFAAHVTFYPLHRILSTEKENMYTNQQCLKNMRW